MQAAIEARWFFLRIWAESFGFEFFENEVVDRVAGPCFAGGGCCRTFDGNERPVFLVFRTLFDPFFKKRDELIEG